MNEKFKEPKVRQVVWLPVSMFVKVLEKAKAEDKAINVVIAEIVSNYIDGISKEVKEITKEVQLYVCPTCQKTFKTTDEFKSHECVKPLKTIVCYVCGKEFKNISEVRIHLNNSPTCRVKLKEWL